LQAGTLALPMKEPTICHFIGNTAETAALHNHGARVFLLKMNIKTLYQMNKEMPSFCGRNYGLNKIYDCTDNVSTVRLDHQITSERNADE
jgi:hypothetical protein